ncbi:hypothetical protein CDD83_3514 [Cordyceps sp. RAO-2017]|nr:hypothetical protein CDD83_3514 [Cordyceps sp. RAO-2017]
MASSPPPPAVERPLRRSARNLKLQADIRTDEALVKQEEEAASSARNLKRPADIKTDEEAPIKREDEAPPAEKRIKRERRTSRSSPDAESGPKPRGGKKQRRGAHKFLTGEDKAAAVRARKLKLFSALSKRSPFPDWGSPRPEECALAHEILARLEGEPKRAAQVVAPRTSAGCGSSPSVLDALVRTILSQNTSGKNSALAKRRMDEVYGGSDRWEAIVDGGQPKLEVAIRRGGLSVVKSNVILALLRDVRAAHGVYSLDHLFDADDETAMREMLSYRGVGPKTASCVLLFCLQRDSFAVDTHVYRLAGILGWRPPTATREETQAHLNLLVPPEEKYPLHVLMIRHGQNCDECRAGGKVRGKCELRNAFPIKPARATAVEDAKEQEGMKAVKKEEDQPS